jgi:MEMO1 family protein
MREPTAFGFYEDNFDMLEKQIKQCFMHKLGPGDLPIKKRDKKLKAVIVPHAGYAYSGPCAAWAYKEIAEAEFPDVFIILGTTHTSRKSGISIEDWKTPLGVVKVDKNLAIKLKENTDLEIDEEIHKNEHSIEVQLPFLQFVNKDKLNNLKILPISVSNDIDFKKLAKDMKKVLKDKKVTYITSSDFTHYGPSYGYVPFSTDIEQRLEKLDKQAFDLITSFNTGGFIDFLNKTGDTICGFMPVLLLMELLENAKPEVLLYYTSGSLTSDFKNSVSYASIIFR